MLPPIPQGLVPVTAQQDEPKPKPAIAPVTPAQETAKGSALGLERDDVSAAQDRAREEQRRRHRQQQESQGLEVTEEHDLAGSQAEPQEAVELSRKGLWVDVKV